MSRSLHTKAAVSCEAVLQRRSRCSAAASDGLGPLSLGSGWLIRSASRFRVRRLACLDRTSYLRISFPRLGSSVSGLRVWCNFLHCFLPVE